MNTFTITMGLDADWRKICTEERMFDLSRVMTIDLLLKEVERTK